MTSKAEEFAGVEPFVKSSPIYILHLLGAALPCDEAVNPKGQAIKKGLERWMKEQMKGLKSVQDP
jgi:hypothetical protein